MKAVNAVVPAKAGTHVGRIPAPRLRGGKLRGNDVTFDGADGYLDLLGQAVKSHGVAVVGHRLMSDHAHGVAVPHQAEALAETFKQVHGRYAPYWNVARAGGAKPRLVRPTPG